MTMELISNLLARLNGAEDRRRSRTQPRTRQIDSVERARAEARRLCGNLTEEECTRLTEARGDATAQVASATAELRSLQKALQGGRPLAGQDEAVASRLNWSLGPGAGRDPAVIGELLEIAGQMTGKINDTPATRPKKDEITRYGTRTVALARTGFKDTLLGDRFFTGTRADRAQTWAHEAHHHLGGRDLEVAVDGRSVSPYGQPRIEKQAKALRNPRSMMHRPEAVTFAFGFQRDDD